MARPVRMRFSAVAAAVATAVATAACGGERRASDPDAVASMLRAAARAAGDGKPDEACARLTADAQKQIVLQAGGRLGADDCSQAVGRALLFLSPLERNRIGDLEPTGIRLAAQSGSAVMRSPPGGPQPPMVVPLTVRRDDGEWKISGFQESAQGVPGY